MRRHPSRLAAGALALAASLALGACSSGDPPDGAASPAAVRAEEANVRVVSPEQARQLLTESATAVLIDVRTPAEFAQGHLEGAELVDYNAPDFRERIAAYPRDGSYVVYCQSGNRSEGARRIMAELGFTDVADIDGGILAWIQAGLPTTT